jgi:hypothetical protein
MNINQRDRLLIAAVDDIAIHDAAMRAIMILSDMGRRSADLSAVVMGSTYAHSDDDELPLMRQMVTILINRHPDYRLFWLLDELMSKGFTGRMYRRGVMDAPNIRPDVLRRCAEVPSMRTAF